MWSIYCVRDYQNGLLHWLATSRGDAGIKAWRKKKGFNRVRVEGECHGLSRSDALTLRIFASIRNAKNDQELENLLDL